MPHRWSPLSTGAIKSYNNGKKKKIIKPKANKDIFESDLIIDLMNFGFTFEESIGCLAYLEKKDIKHALNFFFEIAPYL